MEATTAIWIVDSASVRRLMSSSRRSYTQEGGTGWCDVGQDDGRWDWLAGGGTGWLVVGGGKTWWEVGLDGGRLDRMVGGGTGWW
jgi:hypothetical protein